MIETLIRNVLAFTFLLIGSAVALVISPIGLLNNTLLSLNVKANRLPTFVYQRYWAKIGLYILNVKTVYENIEKTENIPSSIIVSNHPSSLDLLLVAASPVPFVFVMKRELVWQLPIISWAAWCIGHRFIERTNNKKAIETLNNQINTAKFNKTHLHIFAEGSRSKDGVMGEFKKGPFYLSVSNNCYIVPAKIENTHVLYPVEYFNCVKPGTIRLKYFDPIMNEEYDDSVKIRVEKLRDNARNTILD